LKRKNPLTFVAGVEWSNFTEPMMNYRCNVASIKDGTETEMTIVANNEDHARIMLKSRGLLVASVTPVYLVPTTPTQAYQESAAVAALLRVFAYLSYLFGGLGVAIALANAAGEGMASSLSPFAIAVAAFAAVIAGLFLHAMAEMLLMMRGLVNRP